MSFAVEVTSLIIHDNVVEARRSAVVIQSALGTGQETCVRLRDCDTQHYLPVVVPPVDRTQFTHNVQAAANTAGNIATLLRKNLNIAEVESFPPLVVLNEETQQWNVDYKGMLANFVNIPNISHNELVEAFQTAVSSALTSEALRGISFKA